MGGEPLSTRLGRQCFTSAPQFLHLPLNMYADNLTESHSSEICNILKVNLTGIRYITFPSSREVVINHEQEPNIKMKIKIMFDNNFHNLTKG